jgi:hypothetical protein
MRGKCARIWFIVVVISFVAGSSHAQNYNLPWCGIADNDGNLNCAYASEQQCRQTLSGIGGECVRNPAGSGQQVPATPPSSENAQGLLPLQLENPGPPPGLGGSAGPGPPP